MVEYTIYIIHGARCKECKKWVPEYYSKQPDCPTGQKCVCGRVWTGKELINDLGAKIKVKEFNSDRLYKSIVDQYLSRNSTLEYANSMAQTVVAREKARFEAKYGFSADIQQKLF